MIFIVLLVVVATGSLFIYALLCSFGTIRFQLSFRTSLPPAKAIEVYKSADQIAKRRANITTKASPHDPGLLVHHAASGKPVAEERTFDSREHNSSGRWRRNFRVGYSSNWYWLYCQAVPEGQGSRLSYIVGSGASPLVYLSALLLDIPRLFQAMRNGSAAKRVAGGSMSPELYRDLLTSLIACVSFAALWGLETALILIPVILLHEYGHLFAYRLIGQTGNRMMLVPFFGGIAIAGSEHKSELDRAFCAIMGPAICVPVTLVLAVGSSYVDGTPGYWLTQAAFLCAFINAANLFPALPLDGGHSTESILRSISPGQAPYAMMVLTGVGVLLLLANGYESFAFMIGFCGFPAVLRLFDAPSRLAPLSLKTGTAVAGFHIATFLAHAGTVAWFWS
jgi:Zn-dependent protease